MSVTPARRVRPQSFPVRLGAVIAGEMVNKCCVTAAFVWLARTLEPAVYGEVEWALSVTIVFTLAADAGLTTWAAAEIAAAREDTSLLVARVAWLRTVLVLLSYPVLVGVAWSRGGGAGRALAIYGLTLFFTPFLLQYLFNGLFELRWVAWSQAARGVVFLAAVFAFVRKGGSSSAVASAEMMAAGALALCHMAALRFVCRLRIPIREGRRGLSWTLSRAWTIGASRVTWGLHWYAGLIILGYLATTHDVAWYSAALRLVIAVYTIVLLYLDVLLPGLASELASAGTGWAVVVEQSLRLTGWLGCGVALAGTLAASAILTSLFGSPFAAATPALRAAVWVVPIAWTSGHLRYSLIAARQPRKDYHAALLGTATTIGLTVLLVPAFHSQGAAMGLLAGTIVNAIVVVVMARNALPVLALYKSVVTSGICCLVCLLLGAVLTAVAGELTSAIVSVSVFVACGMVAERKWAGALLFAPAAGSEVKE